MQRQFCLWMSILIVCVLSVIASADVAQDNLYIEGLSPSSQLDLVLPYTDQMSLNINEKALKVATSYAEDVKTLFFRARRDGFFAFHINAPLFNNKLSSEGLLMYNGLETEAREGFEESQHRLLWFRLTGKQDRLSYGAEYLYVGRDFNTPAKGKDVKDITGSHLERDRAGGKVWGKWQFGVLSMKASLAELWNNVDDNPNRPRFTTTQGSIALDLALPSWPALSVSYMRGVSESSWKSKELLRHTYTPEAVDVSISYSKTSWDATLSSTYSLATGNPQPAENSLQRYHELSIAYYPTRALYMQASVGLAKVTSWPSVQTTTPSVAFALTYGGLFDRFDLKAEGYYEQTKSTDGLVNTRTTDLKTGVGWNLGESFLGKATLSLQVGYSRYLDVVYPTASYKELSGFLLLKILPGSLAQLAQRRPRAYDAFSARRF